jgi:hypothetical protein
LQEEDTAEHILIQCVTAREVWFYCRQALNLQFRIPTIADTLEQWWVGERARFREKHRKWFDGLVITAGHALWKNRNAWCFQNVERQHSARELSEIILEEFHLLRRVRERGGGVGDSDHSERE